MKRIAALIFQMLVVSVVSWAQCGVETVTAFDWCENGYARWELDNHTSGDEYYWYDYQDPDDITAADLDADGLLIGETPVAITTEPIFYSPFRVEAAAITLADSIEYIYIKRPGGGTGCPPKASGASGEDQSGTCCAIPEDAFSMSLSATDYTILGDGSQNVTLTAEASNPSYYYAWYKDGVLNSAASGAGNQTFSINQPGEYSVRAYASSPSGSDENNLTCYATANIDIEEQFIFPQIDVAPINSPVCVGNQFQLSATSTGTGPITWSASSGELSSTSGTNVIFTTGQVGSVLISVSDTKMVGGELVTQTETIAIEDVESCATISATQSACNGDEKILTALTDGDIVFSRWEDEDGNVIGLTEEVTVAPLTTTRYTTYGYTSLGNVLDNGDFSGGVIGFNYGNPYFTEQNLSGGASDGFQVTENSSAGNAAWFDLNPRPGSDDDMMFTADAKQKDPVIGWEFTATAGQEFQFEGWFANQHRYIDQTNTLPAHIGISIVPGNTTNAGDPTLIDFQSPRDNDWYQLKSTWTAPADGNYLFYVRNLLPSNSGGNDFVLDDFTLYPIESNSEQSYSIIVENCACDPVDTVFASYCGTHGNFTVLDKYPSPGGSFAWYDALSGGNMLNGTVGGTYPEVTFTTDLSNAEGPAGIDEIYTVYLKDTSVQKSVVASKADLCGPYSATDQLDKFAVAFTVYEDIELSSLDIELYLAQAQQQYDAGCNCQLVQDQTGTVTATLYTARTNNGTYASDAEITSFSTPVTVNAIGNYTVTVPTDDYVLAGSDAGIVYVIEASSTGVNQLGAAKLNCTQNFTSLVDDISGNIFNVTSYSEYDNPSSAFGPIHNFVIGKSANPGCPRVPVSVYKNCPPCNQPIDVTVTGENVLCEDSTLTLSGTFTDGGNPVANGDMYYVWYKAGNTPVAGDYAAITTTVPDFTLPTLATTDNGEYILRIQDGNDPSNTGCYAESSLDLTVTPTPASLTVSTPQEYCQDEAGTLEVPAAGTGNSLVWYTAATGGTGSSTTPTVVTTTAGSPVATHYVAQQTSTTTGSCLSDRSAIEVNVTATPDVSVTDPSGVCSPLTVDLSTVWSDVNTSGGTAAYEYSSDGTVFTSITNTAAAVVADSGLYRVIVTNGTCADTANINVEIYSLPVLSLGFSPNDTVCVGTEVTLSDLNYTTGNSYVWSMSGSGTTEEEKVTPSTDLLFNVEVTDGNGCVSTADSVVRVDAAPDLVAPQGDMEVCATTATLPQVTPSVGTGVWSKLSTSTSGTIVDVTDPSTQVTGISPGTFIDAKWTVSNGVCPDVTDTVRVSSLTAINPVVNVNTPLSFNVCEDSDTTIIATGSSAGTYEYYVTGTPSSVLGTDSILDVTNITTVQQITVSFTATECVASGATNPVTKDIVITPMTAPTATITGFADGATYIFNELPGTVTGTAPGTGYDYSWEANPSTKGSANLLDYGFNSTMAYDDVVNLDFIVRNSGGECPSDTAHLEVIRKDITTAEALNDTICVTGGNNYTQTPQNLPNTSNNEQAEWLALVGSPTPSAGTGLDVTLTSKGEYGYVYRIYNPTVLDANSKPIESRDTVMIVVDAEVVGPVSAGVATDVCTDTVSLSGTGLSTGESGFWTGPSGLIFTEATSPTSQVTNFTDGVSHTLTWTKYSEYGVCPSVSGTVNLNKLSSVTAAAITGEDTLDVCLGDPVVLYSNAALASNNETGIWSSTDISLPSTSLNSTTLDITSEITSSAEGNYKLKWTISSTSCPTGSVDSVIVAVSGKPSQPSITGLPTMCEDSTATYTISSDPKATLGYVWSVKGQGSVVGTDTSGVVKFDRQLALTDAQKETVWVYAQSMNVCGGSEKDSMEVIIDLAPRQADYVAPSTSLSLQSDLTSICETTSGEVLEVTTPTGNNATKYRWMVEGTRLGNETTVPLSNQFDASDIPGFSDGSVVNMEVLFGNACGYYGAISDIAVTLVSKNDLEIDLSLANEIALDSVTSRELYAICSLDDSYSIKVEGQGVDLTGTDIVYDLIIDGELVLSDFPSNQLDGSLLLPSAKLPDGIVEVTAEISDPTKGCFTSPAIDSDQISLRDYSFEKFDIVGNKLICESDADLSLSLSIPQDTKDKKHNKIERAIWRFEDGSEMYGTTIEIGDPSKAGEVSLELINVNGCQTFNSEPEINPIEVVIDEKPVIVIEGKPVITVPVDVNNELPEYQLSSYVTNLNASEYTSNWGAESITSKLTESEILSWLSSTSVINPVIDPLDEDVARLIVTVVNGACETKDSIDIRATKPFMPPTAFTPNGDGLNDSWVVEGLTAYNKAVMKIYNRWGQLVFEKYGGYYDQFDGKNLPMATYYWTVEFNEPDKAPESGTVTILK